MDFYRNYRNEVSASAFGLNSSHKSFNSAGGNDNSSRYMKNRTLYISTLCVTVLLSAMAVTAKADVPAPTTVSTTIDELVVVSTPVDTTASGGISAVAETPVPTDASVNPPEAPKFDADAPMAARDTIAVISGYPHTIYGKPASWTYSDPWWHGMWINTAVLSGAFISTLFVLELLPEDATAWNRADISSVPFYERWYRNIFKLGPEWDHDNPIFNYVLHPYAGAAYFMSARTCGFNFWQSMLYSAAISTIGWEFGIEACMERPSYQDLFITPVVGSILGEGFYRLKRLIVNNNYEILGSPVIGHIVAFLLDPVNEVVGALRPGTCRSIGPVCITSQPLLIPSPAPGAGTSFGFSFSATF